MPNTAEKLKKRHPVVWMISGAVLFLLDNYGRLQTAIEILTRVPHHITAPSFSWPAHSLSYVSFAIFLLGLAELIWPEGKVVLNWLVAIDWQSSQLAVRNYESVPFFEVVVKIPEDGSCLESHPIHSLQGNGDMASFGITKQQLGDAAEIAAMLDKLRWVNRDSNGRIKEAAVPMRISYIDRRGKKKNYDALEVTLPFKDSSVCRRAKQPILHRLGFRNR